MSEEGRQIVIKLAVDDLKVVLKVGSEVLHVKEYFLEVLLDDCEDPRQLNVAQTRNNIVSNRVILVTDQDWELNVQTLHKLRALSSCFVRLAELNLPVT